MILSPSDICYYCFSKCQVYRVWFPSSIMYTCVSFYLIHHEGLRSRLLSSPPPTAASPQLRLCGRSPFVALTGGCRAVQMHIIGD